MLCCTFLTVPSSIHHLGARLGIVSTSKENFVIGAKSLPGNPYDGHTLQACIEQAECVSGLKAKEAYADRGYRGHGCNSSTLKARIAGAKRGVTAAIHR